MKVRVNLLLYLRSYRAEPELPYKALQYYLLIKSLGTLWVDQNFYEEHMYQIYCFLWREKVDWQLIWWIFVHWSGKYISYIYIYIYKNRENRESRENRPADFLYIYIYIYIYIYYLNRKDTDYRMNSNVLATKARVWNQSPRPLYFRENHEISRKNRLLLLTFIGMLIYHS